jgi:WD40 repeat protein
MLKKMEGHQTNVNALAVARDGRMIASGDESGEVIAWHGETGESLTLAAIDAHNSRICSLDFSPDGSVLATGSSEDKTKLWGTTAWHLQGKLNCGEDVNCVRYSPCGELLAIASNNQIEIWNPRAEKRIALFNSHESYALSLVWTPDGTRLLSAGDSYDPTIREWDSSTWRQVGHPWEGHVEDITSLAMNASGTVVASASIDNYICIWQLPLLPVSLKHTSSVQCVAFSMDGKHILSGGSDNKISEWAVSGKEVVNSQYFPSLSSSNLMSLVPRLRIVTPPI